MRTEFWKIWTQGGIYLADEADAWSSSAWVALNPAFGNGWMTFPDGIAKRHPDCIIIAAANTWGHGATSEYVGRNRLDAATRDRLRPMIAWPIDEQLELTVATAHGGVEGTCWCEKIQQFRRRSAEHGQQVLITPRATFNGIALLKQGFTENEVIEMTVGADLDAGQRKQIGIGGQS